MHLTQHRTPLNIGSVMDCNKDEARRAKEIAEKKMENKDFVGARRLLLRAQQLYPALEDVSQMLTVCEIHYCAEKVIGSEMDWYSILQVERTADEVSIKQQYQKLAAVLHSAKNKLPGAEAAFKLIGKARTVLSDPTKLSAYDIMFVETTVPKQPPKQPSMRPFSKQPGAEIPVNNPPFTRSRVHQQQKQQNEPGFPLGRQNFWTMCPFCKTRYQQYNDVVSRVLHCQNCKQTFTSHNLGSKDRCQGEEPSEMTNKKRERADICNTRNSVDTESELTKVIVGPLLCQSTRFAGQQSPPGFPRKKQHVDKGSTYEDPVKRSMSGSTTATRGVDPQRSIPNGSDGVEKLKKNEIDASGVNDCKERLNGISKSSWNPEAKPDPKFHEYPDTDFNDFNKERTEDRFAVDQIWAIYDIVDSMPRLYARIREVCSPGFKLRITWLEANLDKQDEIDWYNEDLPIACGTFKLGDSENTEDRLMFSHLISCEKGSGRDSYIICPKKGETWALFKNWDMSWKSDSDNHRQNDFEFVEVLSGYAEQQGITVAYLVKVKGFVSLFKQTSKEAVFPANELLRFSHMIPSFRMTGKERADVPEGSFELDPASVPINLLVFTEKVNHDEKVAGVGCELKGQAEEVESLKEVMGPGMPKNYRNLDDIISQDLEILKYGNGFPTESNEKHEKKPSSQTTASQCSTMEEIGNRSHCLKGNNHAGSSPEDASPSQDDVKKIPDTEFYDFDANRSEKDFQPGQVWALYSDEDSFPKYYARINKVESSPIFKVQITWLEPYPIQQNMLQWSQTDVPVSCGAFRLATSGSILYTNFYTDVSPFSHQVKTGSFTRKRKKYEIYPRKGEIWALYKNFNSNWTCSELVKCKYDVVEVLEDDQSVIRVLVLKQVDGFKTVFKAQEIERSESTVKIPRGELLRFSHQIPAFQLTEERDGSLRGCWELDPASLVVNLKVSSEEANHEGKVRGIGPDVNGSGPKSQAEEIVSKEAVRPSTPNISRNLDENMTLGLEISECTDRVLTKSNGNHEKKQKSQTMASQYLIKEEINLHSHYINDSQGGSCPEDASPSQVGVEKRIPDSLMDHLYPSPVLCPNSEEIPVPESIFYDFNANRSQKEFQPGQVWALYSDKDGLPKYYARISKVETSPNFEVHITWLQACPTPKNILQWSDEDMPVGCGVFWLGTWKTMVCPYVNFFSHNLRVEASGRNKYEIYPRKGEVWGVYKDFDPKWTCSELGKCDYDIVEILEDDGSAIEVLVLKQVDGFKTVFRALVIGGSKVTVKIPWVELIRFSHQIPAFRLTNERDGSLRGYWELDPASFPVH